MAFIVGQSVKRLWAGVLGFDSQKGPTFVSNPPFAYVHKQTKQTPWILVGKRTKPTERPRLVGEFLCQF
jgi:hypothetical protein